MLDIKTIREDTPSCSQLLHFNNAGCALSPSIVTDSTINHLLLEQRLGGYEAAISANAEIMEFYTGLAELLNCPPDSIAFTENASRAWQLALASIPWQAGDQIITMDNEYVSNYLGLLHLKHQKGVEIILVPSASDGLVDINKLEQSLSPKTRLIALTHIASQRGDIQPAAAVGKIAKAHGILYLLDACQSVGQIELDIGVLGCDFLCGTGRKYLRGPRGTGFLYASKRAMNVTEPIFVDNHSAVWTGANSYALSETALRFETWERNIAGKIGLAKAVAYANTLTLEAIESRVCALGQELSGKLSLLSGISVFERSNQRSGIITFNKTGLDASALVTRLRELRINTSVSKAQNAQLDLAKTKTGDLVRASVHYYNTSAEIDHFVEAIDAV